MYREMRTSSEDRGKIRTLQSDFRFLFFTFYAKLSLKEATFQVILSMVPLLLFLYCSLEMVYKKDLVVTVQNTDSSEMTAHI